MITVHLIHPWAYRQLQIQRYDASPVSKCTFEKQVVKSIVKKFILEGSLLTDGFFCYFRLVLHQSKEKKQLGFWNFWSRLKTPAAHCVLSKFLN